MAAGSRVRSPTGTLLCTPAMARSATTGVAITRSATRNDLPCSMTERFVSESFIGVRGAEAGAGTRGSRRPWLVACHGVLGHMVVLALHLDIAVRVVQHGANNACADAVEPLERLLDRPGSGFAGTHHEEHAVGQRA